MPKITTELPASPVSFNDDWKHLKGLRLADPDYGIPGYIDVLLGIDMLNQVHEVCHDILNQVHVVCSPMALNTRLGWALSGTVKHKSPQQQVTPCFSSSTWQTGSCKGFGR